MRRILLVLLFAVASSLTASACGGGDSTGDTPTGGATASDTPAAIPKAEFLKQANAICAKANQELIKTAEEFSKQKNLSENQRLTAAQVAELSTLALPTIIKQFEEIRDLGAPAGEEKKVEKILSAAEAAIEKGERDPASIYGAEGGGFVKANELAGDYGLKKCSE